MALTRRELDTMTCSREHCENDACSSELAFHSACHQGFPTWAFYKDGVIIVKCSVCDQEIAQVAVKEE